VFYVGRAFIPPASAGDVHVSRTFIIGTRGSRLALRQVEIISDALRSATPDARIDVREIHTEGDRSNAPLRVIGGLGVFTKAIEDALLAREVDIAVHSMKDLPAQLTLGLTIAAVPPREDVRDALVTRDGATLADLAKGARIGTGSARRAVQLLALRPDVQTAEIRGNVDTRIRKVDEGDYDGAVLAMAGLSRLGLVGRAAHAFPTGDMTPAVAQGAIAVQVRTGDADTIELVRHLDDPRSRAAVSAERAFLRRLGGGCRLPVGAHAVVQGDTLRIDAMIAGEGDDTAILRAHSEGAVAEAEAIGVAVAEALLTRGASAWLDAASG
jgi:hydroxymethylbilane synthase